MNTPLDPSEMTSPAPTSDLQQQVQSLRTTINVALVILLLISGSVMIFLWRQQRVIGGELTQARKYVEDYEKITAPMLVQFVNGLQAYARTHPDFSALLARYNLLPAATNVPGAAAVPAATQPRTVPAPPTPAPTRK